MVKSAPNRPGPEIRIKRRQNLIVLSMDGNPVSDCWREAFTFHGPRMMVARLAETAAERTLSDPGAMSATRGWYRMIHKTHAGSQLSQEMRVGPRSLLSCASVHQYPRRSKADARALRTHMDLPLRRETQCLGLGCRFLLQTHSSRR